jgi:hypothetical protein
VLWTDPLFAFDVVGDEIQIGISSTTGSQPVSTILCSFTNDEVTITREASIIGNFSTAICTVPALNPTQRTLFSLVQYDNVVYGPLYMEIYETAKISY